jgi:hypothetical protein
MAAQASLYCIDLSGFKFLYQSQNLEYRQAFATFDKVQLFNSNVSTLRAAGNSNLSYYQFLTNKEKTTFTKGRMLHIQSFPSSNFPLVEEN